MIFQFFEFGLIKLSISILNLLFFKFVLICKPQAAFFPLIKLKPNQQTKMTQRISINFNLNRKKANQTTQEFLLGIFNPSEEDTEQKLLGSVQVAQNKQARFLNGKKRQDRRIR